MYIIDHQSKNFQNTDVHQFHHVWMLKVDCVKISRYTVATTVNMFAQWG